MLALHLEDLGRKVLICASTLKHLSCAIDSNGTSYSTKVRDVIECLLGPKPLIAHLHLYG